MIFRIFFKFLESRLMLVPFGNNEKKKKPPRIYVHIVRDIYISLERGINEIIYPSASSFRFIRFFE